MISLASPWLLLLALPVFWWAWRALKPRFGAALQYSSLQSVRAAAKRQRAWPLRILVFLRTAALLCLVMALARPQSGEKISQIKSEGVDIVVALDTSGSMKAIDAAGKGAKDANRLEIAKAVAREFIQGRSADRIGLVVFGEEAFTQCPLTLDYGVLMAFLDRAEIGMAGEGTAIGSAIGVATNRLRGAKGASKVMILVTDGRNTAGRIPPLEAARAAEAFGVKIYTIGIGSDNAYMPVDTIIGRQLIAQPMDLDEETLEAIAEATHGRYFRATDAESLRRTWEMIDQLERTEVEVEEHMEYTELFHLFAMAALTLLSIEALLANTRLRKLP